MSHYNQPPHYHAYLLRFWQERGRDLARMVVWRFSLEDPHTGERRGFANMKELLAFLEERMAPGLEDSPAQEQGR